MAICPGQAGNLVEGERKRGRGLRDCGYSGAGNIFSS